MADSKSKQKPKSQKIHNIPETTEVLYQKIGDRWYAFSVVEDEVFYGSITPDELEQLRKQEKIKNL